MKLTQLGYPAIVFSFPRSRFRRTLETGENVKHQLIAGLCFAVIVALFARDNGYNVRYDGGSLSDTKAGTGLKMYIDAKQVRLVRDNAELAKIPASAITEISYGEDVPRRLRTAVLGEVFTSESGALRGFSEPKGRLVGLMWSNGNQKGGLAVQCDENDYRGVLALLEGVTRKKAVNPEPTTIKN
jgi:hypothetical protein